VTGAKGSACDIWPCKSELSDETTPPNGFEPPYGDGRPFGEAPTATANVATNSACMAAVVGESMIIGLKRKERCALEIYASLPKSGPEHRCGYNKVE
jgi:hypothetical protein